MFPEMQGKDFDDLCTDIKAHGLRNPIIRHNDVILDGRNRHRACLSINVFPTYRKFESLNLNGTVEEYIWSQNVTRRHMTDDQRAMIAVLYKKDEVAAAAKARMQETQAKPGLNVNQTHGKLTEVYTPPKKAEKEQAGVKTPRPGDAGRTRANLAKSAGVKEHKIRQADDVAKGSPELGEAVLAGEMTLREAAREVKPEQPKLDHLPPPDGSPMPGVQMSNQTALRFGELLQAFARMNIRHGLVVHFGEIREGRFLKGYQLILSSPEEGTLWVEEFSR
jgi:hypothetical protein